MEKTKETKPVKANPDMEKTKETKSVKANPDMEKTKETKPVKANPDMEKTKETKPVKANPDIEKLQEELKKFPKIEDKLEAVILFMENAILNNDKPFFRNFWDARRLAMDLFHEHVAPPVRTLLWEKFTDLSKQAKSLKDIFDEKSQFAAEQIEIAIEAFEKEIMNIDELSKKLPEITFPNSCFLGRDIRYYQEQQQKLYSYQILATKVTDLRKELVATSMRYSTKNKFFNRLSKLGDQIFPIRKEMIQEVSERFVDDVQRFTHDAKSNHRIGELRQEIKVFQILSKQITLNSKGFAKVREELSKLWEQLNAKSEERSKEMEAKDGLFEQNKEVLVKELEVIKEQAKSAGTEGKLKEFYRKMKRTELGHKQVNELRKQTQEIEQILNAAHEEKSRLREEARQKREEEQKKLKEVIQQAIDELKLALLDKWSDLFKEKETEILQMIDKCERNARDIYLDQLLPLSDEIAEKFEATSSDVQQVLASKLKRKDSLKVEIEQTRKAMGSSGLDFEQAILLQERMHRDKDRLITLENAIIEFEAKAR